MKKNIKHIIFDLGGVILNIDYTLPQKAFRELGLTDVEAFYSQAAQSNLFDKLEIGAIDEADFVHEIIRLSEGKANYNQVIDAWNSILLDFPLRRLQILQQLQLHYDLFLCSNTNEIHERAFNQILQQTCGYPSLAVFFDKVYLSHRVGMRKPNPEIFELILTQNNLKPENTLFIDDSIQHIHAASSLGIQTIHLTPAMTIENDIFKAKN